MKLKRAGDAREFDVELISRGAALRIRVGEKEITAQFAANAGRGGTLTIDGRRYPIFGVRRKDSILVSVGPASFEFKPAEESSRRRRARGLAAPEITAPMPGKVLRVLVRDGDLVKAGQPLVVIEAMKMETTLAAESDALIRRVRVGVGQSVDHGAVLIDLSPPPGSSTGESAPRAS